MSRITDPNEVRDTNGKFVDVELKGVTASGDYNSVTGYKLSPGSENYYFKGKVVNKHYEVKANLVSRILVRLVFPEFIIWFVFFFLAINKIIEVNFIVFMIFLPLILLQFVITFINTKIAPKQVNDLFDNREQENC